MTDAALTEGVWVTVRMPDGSPVRGRVVRTDAPGLAPGTVHAWRVDIVAGPDGCGLGHDTTTSTCAEAAAAAAGQQDLDVWVALSELTERVAVLERRPFTPIGGIG